MNTYMHTHMQKHILTGILTTYVHSVFVIHAHIPVYTHYTL